MPFTYSQGYTEQRAQRAAVKMPDKTRCKKCNRNKAIDSYSQTQQNKLRDILALIRPGDKNEAHIICADCTSKQIEKQCAECDRWRPLDHFSLRQRKNGDNARCQRCISIQVNLAAAPTAKELNKALDSDNENSSGVENSGSDDESFVTNEFANATNSQVPLSAMENLTVTGCETASVATYRTAQMTTPTSRRNTLPPHLQPRLASPSSTTTSLSRATNAPAQPPMRLARGNFVSAREIGSRGNSQAVIMDDGGGRQVPEENDCNSSDDQPLM